MGAGSGTLLGGEEGGAGGAGNAKAAMMKNLKKIDSTVIKLHMENNLMKRM